MGWQLKEHSLDYQSGRHYAILHDPQTKAEHHLIIYLSHDSCPVCGHVQPKTNTGELDFQTILKEELANLEKAHAQSVAYAKKFRIPAKKA
jgi:hypothetical protein